MSASEPPFALTVATPPNSAHHWREPIVARASSLRILYKVLAANAAIVGIGAFAGTWITVHFVKDETSILPIGAAFLFVGVVISLVVNYLVLRAAFAPLERLEETTRAVREGDLDARVELPATSDPQITQLAETFNSTLDQLAADRKQVRYLASQVVRAQEDERKRISRELHDDTAQLLFAQLIRFATLKGHPNPEVQEITASLEQSTVEAIEGVRRLALELRPPALDDLGLNDALGELSQRFTEARALTVDYEWRGSKARLRPEVELALYRVAQEALWNVAKHSKAEKAILDVVRTANDVPISIRDRGIGFNRAVPYKQDDSGIGLGLFGMEERVSLVGGTLRIWSASGRGTEVFAYVPNERSMARTTGGIS